MLKDRPQGFGLVTILLHWVCALIIVFLFSLGLYMTSLSYYDDWYHKAPSLHVSLGLILFLLMVLRLVWAPDQSHPGSSARAQSTDSPGRLGGQNHSVWSDIYSDRVRLFNHNSRGRRAFHFWLDQLSGSGRTGTGEGGSCRLDSFVFCLGHYCLCQPPRPGGALASFYRPGQHPKTHAQTD